MTLADVPERLLSRAGRQVDSDVGRQQQQTEDEAAAARRDEAAAALWAHASARRGLPGKALRSYPSAAVVRTAQLDAARAGSEERRRRRRERAHRRERELDDADSRAARRAGLGQQGGRGIASGLARAFDHTKRQAPASARRLPALPLVSAGSAAAAAGGKGYPHGDAARLRATLEHMTARAHELASAASEKAMSALILMAGDSAKASMPPEGGEAAAPSSPRRQSHTTMRPSDAASDDNASISVAAGSPITRRASAASTSPASHPRDIVDECLIPGVVAEDLVTIESALSVSSLNASFSGLERERPTLETLGNDNAADLDGNGLALPSITTQGVSASGGNTAAAAAATSTQTPTPHLVPPSTLPPREEAVGLVVGHSSLLAFRTAPTMVPALHVPEEKRSAQAALPPSPPRTQGQTLNATTDSGGAYGTRDGPPLPPRGLAGAAIAVTGVARGHLSNRITPTGGISSARHGRTAGASRGAALAAAGVSAVVPKQSRRRVSNMQLQLGPGSSQDGHVNALQISSASAHTLALASPSSRGRSGTGASTTFEPWAIESEYGKGGMGEDLDVLTAAAAQSEVK